MIVINCWEGDPEAEDLLDQIKKLGHDVECKFLDAEMANASPHAVFQDQVYWHWADLLKALPPS